MKTNTKRLLLFLLAPLLAVTAVTSVFTQTANAITVADANTDQRVQAYLYTTAISRCFSQNSFSSGDNSISPENAVAFKWFVDVTANIGHYIDADDGKVNCNNSNFVKSGINLLGWGDPIDALCASGFKRSNGSDCASGTSFFIKPDNSPDGNFKDAVSQKFFAGGNTAELSGPMKYVLYKRTFEVGCKATAVAPFATATSAQKTIASGNKGYVLDVVDPSTGAITPTIYKSELDKGDEVTVATQPNTYGTTSETCNRLVNLANADAAAYSAYVKQNGAETPPAGPGGPGSGSASEEAETCNIAGVGWIICPAAKFIGFITDAAYAGVEQLLIVKPVSLTDTTKSNPIYTIWASIRNLANVAFIFAFFAIIFSQATGAGIGSYGIKKMLPRLIVAAILVNLSYFICAFAVDLSNIVGAGLDGVINSAYRQAASPAQADGFNWTTVITAALAGTGVYFGATAAIAGASAAPSAAAAAFAALLPFLVVALFAVVTALVILIGRQAIIILLIILAPLAFVAYILPNTEGLFDKWKKLFITMMVFYPLVAVLFAGSKVAASILRDTADGNEFIRVASLGVQFFPLLGLPFLLKFSGGLLSRLAGAVNNPNKGPFDRLKKRADGFAKSKKDAYEDKAAKFSKANPNNFRGKRFGKKLKRDELYKNRAAQSEESKQKYVNSLLKPDENGVAADPRYAAQMAGLSRRDAKDLNTLGGENKALTAATKNVSDLKKANEGILKDGELNERARRGGYPFDQSKIDAATAAQSSITAAEGTAANAQRMVDGTTKVIGKEKLEQVNRVLARGQAVVDEIDTKDVKASLSLAKNIRMDATGYVDLLTKPIGSTVAGMNGQSIIVTESSRAAAITTMIQQGRSLDKVMAAISQIQDKDQRAYAIGQVSENYSRVKLKQAGLTDEAFQKQIIAGDGYGGVMSEADYKVGYRRATLKRMSELSASEAATQETSVLDAVLEASRDPTLGAVEQSYVAKIAQTSQTVSTNTTLRQSENQKTRKQFIDLASKVPTPAPTTAPAPPPPAKISLTINNPSGVPVPVSPAQLELQINTAGGVHKVDSISLYDTYKHAENEILTSPSPDPVYVRIHAESEAELRKRSIIP